MNPSLHKLLLCLSLFICGCTTFQIVDLKPQSLASGNSRHLTNSVVGIETIHVSGGEYRDADKWQQGLANVLRNESVFETVSYPYIDKDKIDLLIRGKVGGDFKHNGAKNFFTWWPGPFIFAHNWRGSRYIYDAHADVEVVDIYTGKVLGKYHAESSHELIHRSNNPGPIIGALFILPGIIKGGMSVSPREKYRQQMYEVAYPNLWKKIANGISEDLSKRYSQRIAAIKDKCGGHLNEAPEIGMVWTEYISCQTRKYRLLGQEPTKSGVISVYISDDRLYRIHVAKDGRIIRWYVKKKSKRLAPANVYR